VRINIAVRQFSVIPFTVWSDDGRQTTKDAQILGCHDGEILCRWISEPGCEISPYDREFTIPEGEGMVWDPPAEEWFDEDLAMRATDQGSITSTSGGFGVRR
jgi:hypothetical protein